MIPFSFRQVFRVEDPYGIVWGGLPSGHSRFLGYRRECRWPNQRLDRRRLHWPDDHPVRGGYTRVHSRNDCRRGLSANGQRFGHFQSSSFRHYRWWHVTITKRKWDIQQQWGIRINLRPFKTVTIKQLFDHGVQIYTCGKEPPKKQNLRTGKLNGSRNL